MKVISLQSGSNGNCIYVETKDVRLLFDAGISGKQAQLRLAAHGRNPSRNQIWTGVAMRHSEPN